MKIEYVEDDRPEITCINCMHRHESRCELDDHYIHYGDMWVQTCEQHKPETECDELDKSLADLGVALVNANGEYRSVYDILVDIADKWAE